MPQVWKILFKLGESEEGREEITENMRVCPKMLKSSDDVAALADWASSAWDYMASHLASSLSENASSSNS